MPLTRSRYLSWLAIVLILQMGLLHLVTAQGKYEQAAYMGYLFAANFFGSLISAFGIYHRQRWGWMLGFFIVVCSMAGYLWSRTLGMPQLNIEEWNAPYGIVMISVDCAFVLVTLLRPWRPSPGNSVQSTNPNLSLGSLVVGLFLVGSAGMLTYQWDAAFIHYYGHHVGSLGQVCNTRETSLADLEETYGVQVSLAAMSMMNSIVDVRIKVVDPDKAHALLQNQAALLINQQVLILAPHMHSHTGPRLKAGKIFTMFFPTQQIIHAGSQVSLVLGPVRVEPVVVK
jgi:hypothetical protein